MVASSRSGVIAVAVILMITISGFISAAFESAIPLVIGVPVALMFYIWRWHLATLDVITTAEVARARKESKFACIFIVITWLFE